MDVGARVEESLDGRVITPNGDLLYGDQCSSGIAVAHLLGCRSPGPLGYDAPPFTVASQADAAGLLPCFELLSFCSVSRRGLYGADRSKPSPNEIAVLAG